MPIVHRNRPRGGGAARHDVHRRCAELPNRPIRLIVPEVVGSATDSWRASSRSASAKRSASRSSWQPIRRGRRRDGAEAAPDGYTLIYGSSGTSPSCRTSRRSSFDPLKDLTPVGALRDQPDADRGQSEAAGEHPEGADRPDQGQPRQVPHVDGRRRHCRAFRRRDVHGHGGGGARSSIMTAAARRSTRSSTAMPMHRRADRRTAAPCAHRQAQGDRHRRDASPRRAARRADRRGVGLPGYDAVGWGAIFVPNGTPQPIIDKLNATIAAFLTRPRSRSSSRSRAPRPPAAPRPRWRSSCAMNTRGSARPRNASGLR